MLAKSLLTPLVAVTLAIAYMPSARGEVTSADDPTFGAGALTIDSAQGLAFLDITLSQGLSFDQVEALLGVGRTYAGFRHATEAEVIALINNYGFSPGAVAGTYVIGDTATDQLSGFVALVGVTAPGATVDQSVAQTGTEPFANNSFYHRVVAIVDQLTQEDTVPAAGIAARTVQYPLSGHWLVKHASVGVDTDEDGVSDDADNCPEVANPMQENNDGDALGDVCDADDDNDGTEDVVDNCPIDGNPDQADFDYDGLGDACDTTIDSGSIAQHVEYEVSGVVQVITGINVSGGNGMVSKLTGNGGVLKKMSSAIDAYEGGMIDLETYLSELDGALSKLAAFDNQVAAKIANGKIVEPEATFIRDASAEIHATIEALKIAAGG